MTRRINKSKSKNKHNDNMMSVCLSVCTLEKDDNEEDKDGGQEIGQIGQIRSVERFFKCTDLVLPSDQ